MTVKFVNISPFLGIGIDNLDEKFVETLGIIIESNNENPTCLLYTILNKLIWGL